MTTDSISRKVTYVISKVRKRAVRDMETTYGDITIPTWAIHRAANDFEVRLSAVEKQKLNGRFQRGLGLARRSAVSPYDEPYEWVIERQYWVQSSDPNKPPYRVCLETGTCTCPDHAKGNFCKHRVAAIIIEGALKLLSQQVARQSKVAENVPTPPVENNPSPSKGESIIWAAIRYNGAVLGVEVLSLNEDMATVRALPVIKEDKKLQPQFPFEGKTSLTMVPKKELFHVRIFQ